MAGTVMRPLTGGGGMQSKWRDGRPMKAVAASFIKPNDRLTSFERLEIYNRQYWYRVKDCFYEDYPGLRAILGEDRFEKLALAYLNHYPSESFTLRNLGRKLVDFLQKEPRWITPHRQAALDMARLEWAHIEAFDNEARPPLNTDSLLGGNPATIRLQLQPHLTLLKMRHELDEFLIKAKKDEGLRSEASNAAELRRKGRTRPLKKFKARITFLAVHRHENTVYYKRLDAGQFLLLSAFKDNATIAEACEELAMAAMADLAKLRSWFESWAALGWFCELG